MKYDTSFLSTVPFLRLLSDSPASLLMISGPKGKIKNTTSKFKKLSQTLECPVWFRLPDKLNEHTINIVQIKIILTTCQIKWKLQTWA